MTKRDFLFGDQPRTKRFLTRLSSSNPNDHGASRLIPLIPLLNMYRLCKYLQALPSCGTSRKWSALVCVLLSSFPNSDSCFNHRRPLACPRPRARRSSGTPCQLTGPRWSGKGAKSGRHDPQNGPGGQNRRPRNALCGPAVDRQDSHCVG